MAGDGERVPCHKCPEGVGLFAFILTASLRNNIVSGENSESPGACERCRGAGQLRTSSQNEEGRFS